MPMLMAGGRYKQRNHPEAHIFGYDQVGSDDPIFICGRGVHCAGDIQATETGKDCAACRTGWQTQTTRRQWEQSLKRTEPPANAEALADRYGAQWQLEDKKLAMHAAWVAKELGGEVIE